MNSNSNSKNWNLKNSNSDLQIFLWTRTRTGTRLKMLRVRSPGCNTLNFGNNSKNAWLHFGKAHGNKVCSFFCFYVYHLWKGLLAKIRCNKLYEYLKGFFNKKRVSYDLVIPKRWERCCSEELLLKVALLKFNDFIEVFIIDIFISTKREWLS